jgi:hypothetical protein
MFESMTVPSPCPEALSSQSSTQYTYTGASICTAICPSGRHAAGPAWPDHTALQPAGSQRNLSLFRIRFGTEIVRVSHLLQVPSSQQNSMLGIGRQGRRRGLHTGTAAGGPTPKRKRRTRRTRSPSHKDSEQNDSEETEGLPNQSRASFPAQLPFSHGTTPSSSMRPQATPLRPTERGGLSPNYSQRPKSRSTDTPP